MELNVKALTLASVIVVGAAYLICALFVLFLPDLTVQLVGYLTHSVSVEIADITPVGFLFGLTKVIAYTGLASWFFAFLYNRLKK